MDYVQFRPAGEGGSFYFGYLSEDGRKLRRWKDHEPNHLVGQVVELFLPDGQRVSKLVAERHACGEHHVDLVLVDDPAS